MIEVLGVRYPTLQAAADALSVTPSAVHRRVHSPDFPDYTRISRPRFGPPLTARAVPPKRRAPGRRVMTFEERQVGLPIVEPEQWPFTGYERRAEVLDPNFDPPRIMRRVGWVRCLRCWRPTFSGNVRGIRLCWSCGGNGSGPIGPRVRPVQDLRVLADACAL